MNALEILFVQSKGSAIFIILALLIIAGAIGYVTAWLFSRSQYSKRIKETETESAERKYKISKLEEENVTLNHEISDLRKENKQIAGEKKALQTQQKESIADTKQMTLKNQRSEKRLKEKSEELANLAKRKHLLDYRSFGTASYEEKNDLQMISGIGPDIEERLHAVDIFTFSQISKFTKKDIIALDSAIEYFSGRIERDEWVAQAKELVISEEKRNELLERIRSRKTKIYYNRIGTASEAEADDLTNIVGIGKWIKKKLNAIAIFSYEQISKFKEDDIDEVTEVIEYFPGRIERDEWIIQARELVRINGKKAELLKRIQEKREIISYNDLGKAQKHQANNLTMIDGISLWIEERLNILEIYTFEQISRLKSKDIKVISEILGMSADRIDKEEWVAQALGFTKKQVKQDVSKISA